MNHINLFPTLLFLVMTAFTISCNSKQQPETEKQTDPAVKQEIMSHKGYPILVGRIEAEQLEGGTYKEWFSESYNNYTPDKAPLDKVVELLENVKIEVFMGTWCEDCQREVPRFFKILESFGIDPGDIEIIALDHHPDRNKMSPGKEEVGKNIESVPTIIFYYDDTEIGRIIESPEATLEKDIAAILSKAKLE